MKITLLTIFKNRSNTKQRNLHVLVIKIFYCCAMCEVITIISYAQNIENALEIIRFIYDKHISYGKCVQDIQVLVAW